MHQREVLRHEGFGADRPYPLRLIAPGAHALWVLSQILVVARCVTLNPLTDIGRLRLQRRAGALGNTQRLHGDVASQIALLMPRTKNTRALPA